MLEVSRDITAEVHVATIYTQDGDIYDIDTEAIIEDREYAISNAPKDTLFTELIKASTMRWPIEQCFQEGKGQLGMDCYEHRSWPAWHRHMIYVFLALHFLLRLRLKFKKRLLY